MVVPVWSRSFLLVVLPVEMESWCLCGSSALGVMGISALDGAPTHTSLWASQEGDGWEVGLMSRICKSRWLVLVPGDAQMQG